MQGPLDNQPRDSHGVYRNWTIKLFALPILVLVALIGFAVTHPGISRWISNAADTEFAATDDAPAKLAGDVRTAKVHGPAGLAPRSIVNSTSISPRE